MNFVLVSVVILIAIIIIFFIYFCTKKTIEEIKRFNTHLISEYARITSLQVQNMQNSLWGDSSDIIAEIALNSNISGKSEDNKDILNFKSFQDLAADNQSNKSISSSIKSREVPSPEVSGREVQSDEVVSSEVMRDSVPSRGSQSPEVSGRESQSREVQSREVPSHEVLSPEVQSPEVMSHESLNSEAETISQKIDKAISLTNSNDEIRQYLQTHKITTAKVEDLKELCQKANIDYDIASNTHWTITRKNLYSKLFDFIQGLD